MTQGETVPVLLNGTDQDGDPLTYEVISPLPAGHLLSGSGENWTYTPPSDFAGDVVFTYVAKDNRGLKSVEAQVVIQVNYLNLVTCPSTVTPTLSRIWPADGRMVKVGIKGGGINSDSVKILYVHQDEKPGKTSDGGPLGGSTTLLRAERLSAEKKGNGRVYLIGYEGRLGPQTGCRGEVQVSVPLTSTGTAKLGSARYDSTQVGSVRLP